MLHANRHFHTLGKRVFYTARRSALLRRIVAMPAFTSAANRIAQRVLQPVADYPTWIQQRLKQRRAEYACTGEPGLLSFLTTVWDMPLHLLRPAVESLLGRQTVTEFQWVILDNGSTEPETIQYLKEIAAGDPRVVYLRAEKNLGIIGGMSLAMANATGRYILPFDSDDLLYPDAVAILTHQFRANHYPPLMYSDEDKLDGGTPCWPYFKPDWDPVLFINSCFIAHLTCIDRALANQLGVFTDTGCDGCHDWDAFTRFMLAGYVPVHIPEMLYSWRMHANSTASNTRSKSYILESQKHLLSRYLSQTSHADKFEIQLSPLFQQTPDWWLRRKPVPRMKVLSLLLGKGEPIDAEKSGRLNSGLSMKIDLTSKVELVSSSIDDEVEWVFVACETLKLDPTDWQAEIIGLVELHPDTVMFGGRVISSAGRVMDAGRVPGFANGFGCPDAGRAAADPGNGAELWKQRSVSGVSTHLCVIHVSFLREIFQAFSSCNISWSFLGAWAALLAWRTQRRIVYTPFLSGVSNFDLDTNISAEETQRFKAEAANFLSDVRFYNRHFSRSADQAYQPMLIAEGG